MTITDWIQAISMLVLVVITGIYAWGTYVISKATKNQAEASVKMAEEMREQRLDSVRPVIDIQWQQKHNSQTGKAAPNVSELKSSGLPCVLKNIGLGPAIDVYYFLQHHSGDHLRHDVGILVVGGGVPQTPLVVDESGDHGIVKVYYRDAYGRRFESRREVRDEEEKGWELGPLQIRLIEKEF